MEIIFKVVAFVLWGWFVFWYLDDVIWREIVREIVVNNFNWLIRGDLIYLKYLSFF